MFGNILSPSGKQLKLRKQNTGYLSFSFRPNKSEISERKSYPVMVHRFVAFQKFGMRIFEKGVVTRHLDGDRQNNNPENIEIGSQSENMFDQSKEVRVRKAVEASAKNRKFTDQEILLIREDSKLHKISYNKIMSKWGISSKGTLSFIMNNNYKTKKLDKYLT